MLQKNDTFCWIVFGYDLKVPKINIQNIDKSQSKAQILTSDRNQFMVKSFQLTFYLSLIVGVITKKGTNLEIKLSIFLDWVNSRCNTNRITLVPLKDVANSPL